MVQPNQLDDPAEALRRMRRLATGLLILMVAVFITARLLHNLFPAVGPGIAYVEAFAEAAMVGALADWFAVTALFRHPLGLPIPHTAIVPRRKDEMGDALGHFIKTNFLTPELVSERLEREDIAAAIGRFLSDPDRRASLARGLTRAVPRMIGFAGDEEISRAIRSAAARRLRDVEAAPLLASMVDLVSTSGRHQLLVDAALVKAREALTDQETDIREKIRDRTNWLFRLAGVDEKAADALLGTIESLLDDVIADPEHPFRRRATELLSGYAERLRSDPKTIADIEALKVEVIEHPVTEAMFDDLWTKVRTSLEDSAARPSSALQRRIDYALERASEAVLSDPALAEAINSRIRSLLVELTTSFGDKLAGLVSGTIRSWDSDTVVDKMEGAVGRDLQYIRINGTLIGGLVGLAIHGTTQMLGI